MNEVEVQAATLVRDSRFIHTAIGQLFGDQAVIVFAKTVDRQIWRAIYLDATMACWVLTLAVPSTSLFG